MYYHTTFQIDMAQANEWLACLWQGPAPADLKVHHWLTLAGGGPRTSILIWEGGPEGLAFVERVFGGFGKLETREATNSTGMASAFARDLPGYENMMHARKVDAAEIARQVDLRRRGMEASDPASAKTAAKAWAAQKDT